MSRPMTSRPQTRIRGDNFLKTELDHELFAAVFIAGFSSAFMGAWNFHFPTTAERNLWRCASVYTLGYGMVGSIYVWIWDRWLPPRQQGEELEMGRPGLLGLPKSVRNGKMSWTKRIGAVSPDDPPDAPIPISLLGPCTFLCFFYCLFRIYILVEDVIGLRSLPLSAFDSVRWSDYIPHI